MLSIDSLQLHLPAAFERRAGTITRLLVRELERLPAPEVSVSLPRLDGVALQLDPALPDGEVAARIAAAVHAAVRAKT